MDLVELPLSAVTVSKLMRSGCSGVGGVTTVELVGASQLERDTCSSFHPHRDNNCTVNGSRPGFWTKTSDADLYRQASQFSSLGNEEVSIDLDMEDNVRSCFDMASNPEAKQSQRRSGKAARNSGSSSRRSRVANMEASLHITGSVDGLPKELGSYPGRCNSSVTEKMQTAKQKTNVSGKRSERRNGKASKSKCESFSIKAGLSSFSSAAGGNNLFGIHCSKQDISDLAKHVDELSVNELLDGSYKFPYSAKDKGKKPANPNENILHSVRVACSVLQPRKPSQTLKIADIDSTCHQTASSCLPCSGTSGAGRSDDDKGVTVDPSSFNKVEDSCSDLIDHAKTLESPLFTPKDVLERLALPPSKDLDLLLLDNVKPASTSKGNHDPRVGKPVHNRGGLPTFPWSHASGGHSKTNADAVKLTPSRSSCQGRWVKMGNSTTSLGDTTAFIGDLESLTYDQGLVPLECQQPRRTEKEKSPPPAVSEATSEQAVKPSGTHEAASNIPDEQSPGILTAAQTLCDIAAHWQKQDQNVIMRSPKKPPQKSMRASKLKSDEKLEKALFTIPSSRAVGPSHLVNCANEAIIHPPKRPRQAVNEKSNNLSNTNSLTKRQFHWPTTTPQSSRSSTSKPYKDGFTESKHHVSSLMRRPFAAPSSTNVPNKASKLRKIVPMEWKSRIDQKGNVKY